MKIMMYWYGGRTSPFTFVRLPYFLCRIQGYPTIKTFSKGRFQDYQQDRSVGALKEAGLRLLSDTALKTLSTSSQVKLSRISEYLLRRSEEHNFEQLSAYAAHL